MSKLIYENPLSNKDDIKDFILEGKADISFFDGVMRLENNLSAKEAQKAGFVLWCPMVFPADVSIEWEFRPIKEPGCAQMFFAAKPKEGPGSIFGRDIQERNGEYEEYHSGDLNAFHISYFRRREPSERYFHTCNLRKSYGCHLVAQGADPIPDASGDAEWYRITITKRGSRVYLHINELQILEYIDDGITYGNLLTGGNIGLRQVGPMAAEYRNLKVTWI